MWKRVNRKINLSLWLHGINKCCRERMGELVDMQVPTLVSASRSTYILVFMPIGFYIGWTKQAIRLRQISS